MKLQYHNNILVKEIWKSIEEFSGYEVSNYGRIRSIKRWIKGPLGHPRLKKGMLLKLSMSTGGYSQITLKKDNRGTTRKIHQLVAIAFLNHIANGMKLVIDHIDDVKTNNFIYNLRVVTNRVNTTKNKNSVTGFTGVSFVKGNKVNPFKAQIRINGKLKHLGVFSTAELASKAYQDAII